MSGDLVERLLAPSDGWSGDASCVSAELAAEAAAELTRLRSEKAERPVVSVNDDEIAIEWRGKVLLNIDADGVSYALHEGAWLPGSFDPREDWIDALGEIRRALFRVSGGEP